MLSKEKEHSDFSKNVLTLMTGTTLSQAIPIAISPILTRIYRPEDFGIYAIFVALITILGTMISGRYELAIMLPNKDEDALNIFILGIIITSLMTLMISLIIYFFSDNLISYIDNKKIKYWLYFVPISIFFAGANNLLNYYNNRFKEYKTITTSLVMKSMTAASVQLLIGLIKKNVSGLILGQIFSQIIANLRLSKVLFDKILFDKINKQKIIKLGLRYIDFPKYSVFAILANKMSYQLTNIIISSMYSIMTLGYYSLVQRVLGLPSSLIGTSIGKVFFSEANQEKRKYGNVINSFRNTIIKLIIIGIPIFGLLYFTVENLFAFVFGEEWRVAGEYAKIIIPFYFIQFIVSAISTVEAVMEKQNIDLIFNICLLLISIVVICISMDLNFKIFLINWTISMIALYSLYSFILYKMAKGEL